MYKVRLWSVRHSRFMEGLYGAVNPTIVGTLRIITKVFGTKLDKPITAAKPAVLI